jgi:hypothetical protein
LKVEEFNVLSGSEAFLSRGEKQYALHIPSVLSTHLIQSLRDLTERANPNRFHELGKDVSAGKSSLLQTF